MPFPTTHILHSLAVLVSCIDGLLAFIQSTVVKTFISQYDSNLQLRPNY
jgi:hypothetical protein